MAENEERRFVVSKKPTGRGVADGLQFVAAFERHRELARKRLAALYKPKDPRAIDSLLVHDRRVIEGQADIAAQLGLSVRQLRDRLDPKHSAYDYQLNWAVERKNGRYKSTGVRLVIAAVGRLFDTARMRAANASGRSRDACGKMKAGKH